MFFKISLTALILADLCLPADHLDISFDNQALGTYTKTEMKADWAGESWDNGITEGRGTIVDGANAYQGKALEVRYVANKIGPEFGVQFQGNFTPTDAAYLEYRVKFPTGFSWVKGGKLPGLCGGSCSTGDEDPTGANGWSARFMWRENGKAIAYVYHMNWLDFGESIDLRNAGALINFQPGKWYHIKEYIQLNTPIEGSVPEKRNGIIQVWIDDQEVLKNSLMKFRTAASLKINKVYFSTFFGGGDNSWAPPADQLAYFDDFHVSSAPITAISKREKPSARLALPNDNGWIQLSNPNRPGRWHLTDLKGKSIGSWNAKTLEHGTYISIPKGRFFWIWKDQPAQGSPSSIRN